MRIFLFWSPNTELWVKPVHLDNNAWGPYQRDLSSAMRPAYLTWSDFFSLVCKLISGFPAELFGLEKWKQLLLGWQLWYTDMTPWTLKERRENRCNDDTSEVLTPSCVQMSKLHFSLRLLHRGTVITKFLFIAKIKRGITCFRGNLHVV